MNRSVEIIGVRHHSPACARLVRETVLRRRPDFVLIEGPSDFNPRMEEMMLDHKPPLALFSYYQDDQEYHRSYCPFCAYSPEWVALQTAREIGSQALFMDLPSWTRAFRNVENRYHDEDRSRDYVARLCERMNLQGLDELWDHLFEQPEELEKLAPKLTAYFRNLRDSSVPSESDLRREEFMASFVSWAAHKGDVLAICGGFHQSAIEELWLQAPSLKPEVPIPQKGRFGSFLVPYSFRRLDSFSGYAAGMPSPNFYHLLWSFGPQRGSEEALRLVVDRLRAQNQAISAADLIACHTMIEGLRKLRGHAVPTRSDLLDGLAASLIKHGLDRPLPWTERGPLPRDTAPMLVEIARALSGDKEGVLDDETPLPPLVKDVDDRLSAFQLTPTVVEREVEAEPGCGKSHTLHRLTLLEIPGFRQTAEEEGREAWLLLKTPDFEAAVVEAGALGATLEEAAYTKLEREISSSEGSAGRIAELLVKAYRAGLRELPRRLLQILANQVSQEKDFVSLGSAAGSLLSLWRSYPEKPLQHLLWECCGRLLWLVELMSGANLSARAEELDAFVNLRDCYRLTEMERQTATDVFLRRASEPTAPPAHRGAALGLLWGALSCDSPLALTLECLRECSTPARLGDVLAGLFAVAREEVLTEEDLVAAVDHVLSTYSPQEFLIALPALRLAYSYFPPREKEAIAASVLRGKGLSETSSWQFVEALVSPELTARNRALERELEDLLGGYGLGQS